MSNFYPDIHIARLKEAFNRIGHEIIVESVPLEAEYAVTREPVPYGKHTALKYKPIEKGEKWGDLWDCGWFKIKGEVPAKWKGGYVALNLDFTGEALIYDKEGCPLVGLTNGSAFEHGYSKDMFHWLASAKGGEKIDFWVETGAQGIFGAKLEPDPAWITDGSDKFGKYPSRIEKMSAVLFDYDKWQLRLDLEIIIDLIETLAAGTARRMQVLRIASRALDALPPERGGAKAVRKALKPIFELGADPATVTVNAIGHAHIDTAWLWPLRETVRKVGRTFASQILNIERYPGYKFGASQPQLYKFCKDNYPKLYAKIKKAVKAGAWELQGGMWVEADCNIPNGESLIRQLLIGRDFYREEFGADVNNVWLPDVFGYSGNLPQIMKSAGVDYFLTQKISWNRYNKFPHNTFVWRGIDGSEVLAHFPPEDDYNSYVKPSQLRKHETNNAEAGLVEDAISLYGIGDGGGGPKEEYVERGIRCANLNGCPKFTFAFAQPALERMGDMRAELSTWVGELYFELHRATFTTQAQTKRLNRRAEEALRAVEMVCAAAGAASYPTKELAKLWEDFLCGQFHDIIPGSSINRVYAENIPMLENVIAQCKQLQAKAAAKIMRRSPDSATYFNPSSTPFAGAVNVGQVSRPVNVPVQREADDYIAWLEIPARGFVTLELTKEEEKGGANRHGEPSPAITAPAKDKKSLTLENAQVKYVFNTRGQLTSIYDKETKTEHIPANAKANAIALYDDHPAAHDAWDVEEYAFGMPVAEAEILSAERITGPVRDGIMFYGKIGSSTFIQTAWLAKTGKRLDFVTDIDWCENHRIARVAFPYAENVTEARFEIQYGTVARPTHDNTKWQAAQFEVCGHRYADVSEPGFGFALLNDSKYGYSAKDGVLSLTLLRAPTYPDPVADRGAHRFTYSALPHAGTLADSDEVVANAAVINQGIECFPGFALTDKTTLPVTLDGDGIELSVIKKAEKSDALVVRLVERRGRTATGTLHASGNITEIESSEWRDLSKPVANTARLTFRPFEIKTYKIV